MLACVPAAAPAEIRAQGVVVDEGSFAVTIDGREAGSEEFTIRRAGLNRDDALFATATVNLARDGGTQRIEVVYRATPGEGLPKCDGTTPCYQVDVDGPDAISLRLALAGRRYVARVLDRVHEEIREFPAAPGTRILETDVAHLYYFLRDVPQGTVVPVLGPRERSHTSLTVGAAREESLQLGPNVVDARRVELSAGDDRRIVWFDRLGRVLRVSIPARGYVAQRTDLVG